MKDSFTDFKRPKFKGITPVLKRQVWERHIGIGVLEAACPLCGYNKIYNGVNNGFQLAHLIADKYLNEDLTLLYSYVACASCINECGEMTVFDYLYCRGRLKQLKKLIMSMYDLFLLAHGDDLVPEHNMAWKVMDYLYGPKRFPAGGGIVNCKQVYEIARLEQYNLLAQESSRLARELERVANSMAELMECNVRTMNLF
jgi:hypothetical protein